MGEKRKEGRFSPSALSLFRFHLSPFPQKRLILRLTECRIMVKTGDKNYRIIQLRNVIMNFLRST